MLTFGGAYNRSLLPQSCCRISTSNSCLSDILLSAITLSKVWKDAGQGKRGFLILSHCVVREASCLSLVNVVFNDDRWFFSLLPVIRERPKVHNVNVFRFQETLSGGGKDIDTTEI